MKPTQHKMEYEKTLWPFAIITKKRYVGNLYETDPNKYKQKSMGIVLKRRDNAPIVKIVVGGIIKQILINRSPQGAVKFTRDTLTKILAGKYDLDKFVITKTLKSTYKDRTRISHAVLADRMTARDPGNRVMPNDRLSFAFIEPKGPVELQGDRIEHINYIREHKLKLDYLYYITNQIMVPSLQFLELIVEKKDAYSIFHDYIIREENRRSGIKPINYYCLNQKTEMETEGIQGIDNLFSALGPSQVKPKEMKKHASRIKKKSEKREAVDNLFEGL